MRVSVILPTFNRSRYLGECLDSLLAQTWPAYEIIVVDDGSEDDTAEVLDRYAGRIRAVYKRNEGKPSAVNLGLSLAQAELVWIFDDDDVALPDAIEQRTRVLASDAAAMFVYSPHYMGHNGPDGRIVRGALRASTPVLPERLLSALMEGCFFSLSSALVRADAYRAVGGFDTSLLSSEDYDMQLRLAARFRGIASQDPSFIARQHDGLRGAHSIRYGAHERATVFRRYSQRIGQKLRSELTLGDYLVSRCGVDLSPHQQREALLARALTMASQGCIPELLQDMRTALSISTTGPSLSKDEYLHIARAIRTGYAFPALQHDGWGSNDWARELRRCRGGRLAILALADGIWRMARGYPGTISQRLGRLCIALATARKALI